MYNDEVDGTLILVLSNSSPLLLTHWEVLEQEQIQLLQTSHAPEQGLLAC